MAVVSRPTSGAKTTAGLTIGKYSIVRELGARRPSMVLATGVAPSGVTDFAILELIGEDELSKVESAALVIRARRLAQIRHPNLGRIRDVMVQKDRIAIVSDYIEGETLATLLERDPSKRFGLVERLRILVDVLSGLSSLHLAPELPLSAEKEGKSPLFGALHPGNVVVGTDGSSRLVRLVRLPDAAGAFESPRYAAPELLLGDETSSVRADLYAVGVLLWEALSGTRLFEIDDAKEILARQLAGALPLATVSEKAEWASALVEVAARALDVDPEKRFASAAELAGAIRLAVQARLASTAKIGGLVKELGKEAIAARQALLKPPTKTTESAEKKPVPRATAKTIVGVPKLRAPSYGEVADLEMETVDEEAWAHEAPTGRGETIPAKGAPVVIEKVIAKATAKKKSMPPPPPPIVTKAHAQETLLAKKLDSVRPPPPALAAPAPVAPPPAPPQQAMMIAPIPPPFVPNIEFPPPPPMVTPPPMPVVLDSQPQTLSPATPSRPITLEASAIGASTQRTSRVAMGLDVDDEPRKKKRHALLWIGSAGGALLLLFVIIGIATHKNADATQATTTSGATTPTTTTAHDDPAPIATQAEAPIVTTTSTIPSPPPAFTAEPIAPTEPTEPTNDPTSSPVSTTTKPAPHANPIAAPHGKPGKKRPPRSNYEPEGI